MFDEEIKSNQAMILSRNKKHYGVNMTRLDAKPIITTYYQISVPDSTVSSGTETIQEKIGSNSPLRFRKIQNFPLYGFREFNREANRSEKHGITLSLNNESIVLGGTIIPHIGDFLEAKVGSTILLFEVTTATPVSLLDVPHYRLSYDFKASNTNDVGNLLSLIEEQVIEECICKFDNLGTEKVSIVSLSAANSIVRLSKVYKKINDRYMHRFYDEITNNLVFNDKINKEVVYSALVTEFQIQTRCIMFELGELCCQELLLTHEANDIKDDFMDSVYYDIIEEMTNDTDSLDLDIEDFNDVYMDYKKNAYYHRRFSSLNYYDNVVTVDNSSEGVSVTLNKEHPVISAIKASLLDLEDKANMLNLKKLKIDNSLESYLMTPILLCIVKNHMERIQTL